MVKTKLPSLFRRPPAADLKRAAVISILATLAFVLPASFAMAQAVNIDLGTGAGLTDRVVQLIGLMTVLSLAPSIVIMTTSFVRIVVVLSLLRQALGLQQTPPNQVLVGLSLFLSMFVMQPVLSQINKTAIEPYGRSEVTLEEGITRSGTALHGFMVKQTRKSDLNMFANIAKAPKFEKSADVPFSILLPAFVTSELKTAFQIGFLIFLPFLVIDLIVASALMSLGMMMLSPSIISMPFKLLLFVLVDGWALTMGSLASSFNG